MAALVTWLCHEVCDSTAGVYEAGGGFFRRTRWESTAGLFLTAAELGEGVAPKPEHVEAGKAALLDFGAAVRTPSMTNRRRLQLCTRHWRALILCMAAVAAGGAGDGHGQHGRLPRGDCAAPRQALKLNAREL